jgi:hypothetical protein
VADARTVSIPIFENRTFRRGVETDLARLLASEVQSRTRLRLVDSGADLVVEGTIVEMKETLLSERKPEEVRESSMLVTVEFTVRDGRTGATVVAEQRLTERESFVPVIAESVRTARAEALKRLAADIVDRLEAP